jgi:UDP-4-amino-4-deoxy-L-arabinose formyltransferase/UDP-glucuronic acid dehydrogenase (UDP-4-keto-hexauronic acid decarboxylating)
MSEPLRVLLVAAEAAGAHVLRSIEGAGLTVAGVLMSAGERGERPLGNGVRATIERLGCPVWPAKAVRDPAFADVVREARTDLLINVHSLYVIRGEILDAPRIGSFNMHPGPLPEGAGLNAPSWALYDGNAEHAVTVHWMAAGIDTGEIAYEARFPVEETDTAWTLSAKCVKQGVPLVERLLSDASRDAASIPRIAQDLSRRRYRGREVPQGGWLDWTRPARDVVGFVRACDYMPFASPWANPRCVLEGQELSVLKAARTGIASDAAPGCVGAAMPNGVLVSASDEWVLVQRMAREGNSVSPGECLPAGKRFEVAAAFH